MNGNPLQERIVLLPFKTLRGVLLILGSDVAGHSWNAAFLLLCALEDDLHPVTFCFLCHNFKN